MEKFATLSGLLRAQIFPLAKLTKAKMQKIVKFLVKFWFVGVKKFLNTAKVWFSEKILKRKFLYFGAKALITMKLGFKIEINQDRNLGNFVIFHYYPTIRDKGIIYYGNRPFLWARVEQSGWKFGQTCLRIFEFSIWKWHPRNL